MIQPGELANSHQVPVMWAGFNKRLGFGPFLVLSVAQSSEQVLGPMLNLIHAGESRLVEGRGRSVSDVRRL